jgi:hypothetical protein
VLFDAGLSFSLVETNPNTPNFGLIDYEPQLWSCDLQTTDGRTDGQTDGLTNDDTSSLKKEEEEEEEEKKTTTTRGRNPTTLAGEKNKERRKGKNID